MWQQRIWFLLVCASRCLALDPMFGTVSLSPHVTAALAVHNKLVPVPLSVDTALAQRQRALTAQVDLAASRFQLEAKRCCFCWNSAWWGRFPGYFTGRTPALGAGRWMCWSNPAPSYRSAQGLLVVAMAGCTSCYGWVWHGPHKHGGGEKKQEDEKKKLEEKKKKKMMMKIIKKKKK